jgi:parvulin-like peptidyl-prolyl isomerase
MGRQGIGFAAVLALLAALAGCGGGGESGEVAGGASSVDELAVIGGVPLNGADIDFRLSRMDAETRSQFNDPANLSALIDREVRMRVLAQAAEDDGYLDSEEYKIALENAKMMILADIYSRELAADAENISEQDLREAYDRDKHMYSSNTVMKARHILCATEADALEALEAVRGGMDFGQAVARYSRDSYTKSQGGDLGSLSSESIIPGLGAAPDFVEAVSSIADGEVGGPIQTRAGYHIVQVTDRVMGQVPAFEEIRGTLRRRLEKERSESGLSMAMERLWDRYDVTINELGIKRYIGFPTTPEAYVRTLREVTSSGDKITLCTEMVKEFPGHKYAPYMLFTKGFVYSEELHNYAEAHNAFEELLQRYPDSNYAGAARWMIDNMEGGPLQLRNVEDAVNRAKSAGY